MPNPHPDATATATAAAAHPDATAAAAHLIYPSGASVLDYVMVKSPCTDHQHDALVDLLLCGMPFTAQYGLVRHQRVTVARGATLVGNRRVTCENDAAAHQMLRAVGDMDAWIVFGPECITQVTVMKPERRVPPVPDLRRAVAGTFVDGSHVPFNPNRMDQTVAARI